MTRRDFYRYATMAVGGLMGLVLAVPGVAYVVSPLRKKEGEGSFETLTRLNQLDAGVPRSFAIIKERQDAWVKYPARAGRLGLADPPAAREASSRSSRSRPSAPTWAVRSTCRPTRRGSSARATPARSTSTESPPTRSRRGRWIDSKVELSERRRPRGPRQVRAVPHPERGEDPPCLSNWPTGSTTGRDTAI